MGQCVQPYRSTHDLTSPNVEQEEDYRISA